MSANELLIVGAGGGRVEANTAKVALQSYWPDFVHKRLKGIVLTSPDTEVAWG